ncbi:MAG: cation diffusion facilitator family transporter [Acidobacteria bacterium]|nr:cation diffusion facilitator family transporter [Acidobacteriota bacterium]
MSRYLHPCTELGSVFHNRPAKHAEDRRLRWVIAITTIMMIGEIVGGLITHSLALLSDAGHMLTHLFALVMSLAAVRIASRPTDERRTFGYYRIEVLAALFNALTIFVIVGYIFYGAVRQILAPQPIHAHTMLGIAVLGLIVNLAGAWMLHGVMGHDLNIRGAFVHLLTDTLSSVAIVVGGVVMLYTEWYWVDIVLSLVIGGVVLTWGLKLLLDASHVLLESTPKELSLPDVCNAIKSVPGVQDVHDAHVWEITSQMYSMTGHLVVQNMTVRETQRILAAVNHTVHERFRIGHTTFQFEVEAPSAVPSHS